MERCTQPCIGGRLRAWTLPKGKEEDRKKEKKREKEKNQREANKKKCGRSKHTGRLLASNMLAAERVKAGEGHRVLQAAIADATLDELLDSKGILA